MGLLDRLEDKTEFTDKVKEIRTLRHENPALAKEKISEIRGKVHELQDVGVRVQNKLLSALDTNPDLSLEQTLELAQEFNLSADGLAVLKSIYSQFQKRRSATKTILHHIETQADKSVPKDPEGDDYFRDENLFYKKGELLYELVTGQKPKHRVKFMYSPFALGLQVTHPNDYTLLKQHKSDGIRGYYQDKIKITGKFGWLDTIKAKVSLPSLTNLEIPFIFLNDTGEFGMYDSINTKTASHEITHGINKAIFDGVINSSTEQKDKATNLATLSVNHSVANTIKLVNNGELSVDDAAERLWRTLSASVLPKQMDIVQDELSADFKAKRNFGHVDNLLFRQDQNALTFSEEYNHYIVQAGLDYSNIVGTHFEAVFKKIAKRYSDLILRNTKFLKELVELREKYDPGNTCDDIVAFMRQNPVNFWGLRASQYFSTEYQQLREKKGVEVASINLLKDNIESTLKLFREKNKDMWSKISSSWSSLSSLHEHSPESEDPEFQKLRDDYRALQAKYNWRSGASFRIPHEIAELKESRLELEELAKHDEDVEREMRRMLEATQQMLSADYISIANRVKSIQASPLFQVSKILDTFDQESSEIESVNVYELFSSLRSISIEVDGRRLKVKYTALDFLNDSLANNTQSSSKQAAFADAYPEICVAIISELIPKYNLLLNKMTELRRKSGLKDEYASRFYYAKHNLRQVQLMSQYDKFTGFEVFILKAIEKYIAENEQENPSQNLLAEVQTFAESFRALERQIIEERADLVAAIRKYEVAKV